MSRASSAPSSGDRDRAWRRFCANRGAFHRLCFLHNLSPVFLDAHPNAKTGNSPCRSLTAKIWTAANLIIKRLGAEARREAVERAGDMLVRGDAEDHAV